MGGTDSSSLNFLTLYTIMSFLLWKEFQEVETLILKSFTLDFFFIQDETLKKQLTAIQHDKVCQERSGANLMLIAVYFKLANSVKSSDKNLSQSIRQMFKLTQFAGLCSSQ